MIFLFQISNSLYDLTFIFITLSSHAEYRTDKVSESKFYCNTKCTFEVNIANGQKQIVSYLNFATTDFRNVDLLSVVILRVILNLIQLRQLLQQCSHKRNFTFFLYISFQNICDEIKPTITVTTKLFTQLFDHLLYKYLDDILKMNANVNSTKYRLEQNYT